MRPYFVELLALIFIPAYIAIRGKPSLAEALLIILTLATVLAARLALRGWGGRVWK